MKTTLLILTAFLTLLTTKIEAKIWIVNNNPGGAGNFTTAQAAHDGAAAGDTLYLVGSATTYSLTISKNMTVIGEGYYLAENNIYNTPKINSKLDLGTFNDNIEATEVKILCTEVVSSPSVNKFMKLHFEKCLIAAGISIGTSSKPLLSINRCIINGQIYPAAGPTIGTVTNSVIAANLYLGDGSFVSNISFHHSSGTLFTSNSHIENSIIRGSLLTNSGNTATNNLIYGDAPVNAIPGNIYISVHPYILTGSPDAMFKLSPSSPAIGAGTNGVDIGAFGGSNPYELSGLPDAPIFETFTTPVSGSKASGLPVTIRVRAN